MAEPGGSAPELPLRYSGSNYPFCQLARPHLSLPAAWHRVVSLISTAGRTGLRASRRWSSLTKTCDSRGGQRSQSVRQTQADQTAHPCLILPSKSPHTLRDVSVPKIPSVKISKNQSTFLSP